MKVPVAIFAVLCTLTSAMHTDDITHETITMDEYLDLVTASVDNEIDSDSCMGHTPPNRWYYAMEVKAAEKVVEGVHNENVRKYMEDKEERLEKAELMLALVVINHYKYVRQLRNRIAYIRQTLDGKIDFWPAKHPTCKNGETSPVQPIQSDCTKFYQCSNGILEIQDCPNGTVFNPDALVCDWPANVPKCNAETGHYRPGTFDDDDEARTTVGHDGWMQPQWLNELMMQQEKFKEAWEELKAGDTLM